MTCKWNFCLYLIKLFCPYVSWHLLPLNKDTNFNLLLAHFKKYNLKLMSNQDIVSGMQKYLLFMECKLVGYEDFLEHRYEFSIKS